MGKLDEAVAIEIMGWHKGKYGQWQDEDGINQAAIKSGGDEYAYSPTTEPAQAKEVYTLLISQGYGFDVHYRQSNDMDWREDGSNWSVIFEYAPNKNWMKLYTVWSQPSLEMGICRAALRVRRNQHNITHPQEDWSDFEE